MTTVEPPAASQQRSVDLTALGEVMLRLSAPAGQRLARAHQLDVAVAGSQYNVAANLASLGLRTSFASLVPANPLGDLVAAEARRAGVDTRWLVQVADARVGVNFVEVGPVPTPAVVYDRGRSAASAMDAASFDWEELTSRSRVAHTDGVMLGLSAGCRRAARSFLTTARATGTVTTFDVNYRSHLWRPAEAAEAMTDILPFVDVLLASPDAGAHLLGVTGSPLQIASELRNRFGIGHVLVTTRHWLAADDCTIVVAADVDGQTVELDRRLTVRDRFGTGDALLSGYLAGLLRGQEPSQRVALALAASALAHATDGDVLQSTTTELDALAHSVGPMAPLER